MYIPDITILLLYMDTNMKTQLIIMALLLNAVSCASQKRETISKSTIKLEGKRTNIRDVIEIDGYYQNLDSARGPSYMMFFEGGSCYSIWFKEGVTEEMKRKNLSQAVRSWKEKGLLQCGIYCGAYKINKDTIITQSFVKAGIFNWNWSFYEIKYEIIDRQTLKNIDDEEFLSKLKKEYNRKEFPYYDISKANFMYEFVPADSLPSSDCWLKEEKWIWRNEQDWKNYMDKVKQEKN